MKERDEEGPLAFNNAETSRMGYCTAVRSFQGLQRGRSDFMRAELSLAKSRSGWFLTLKNANELVER